MRFLAMGSQNAFGSRSDAAWAFTWGCIMLKDETNGTGDFVRKSAD
jgi:hypothetical protein